MSDDSFGRKVFFIYPPSVIQDSLVSRLLSEEYEVYMLRDLTLAERCLKLYPNSICFINIDAGLALSEWEEWIKKTISGESTKGVGIGILSYNSDEALQKKYLMDIGIQCGFIKLKLGLEESTRILLATLKANEARGRRKYVRASCEHDVLSGLNLREGPIQATGNIHDISVVGFSCVLDPDPQFKKNSILHDVQLKLRATLIRTQAVVFGSREEDGRTVYVMLFPQLDSIGREKIRGYIQYALQSEIEIQANGA